MDGAARLPPPYRFGEFCLDPASRILHRAGVAVPLSPRAIDLLVALIEARDRVLSRAELLTQVWPGLTVEDHNISVQMSALRRALNDTTDEPRWIATIPGRGYRFIGRIEGDADAATLNSPARAGAALRRPRRLRSYGAAMAVLLSVAVVASGVLLRLAPPPPARVQAAAQAPFAPPAHSIAVLAFTNMSADPAQDYFSDGLAEELIDSLSRVGALHVAARLSAFSFKGRQVTIADIARALGVGAVLEGSVRRDRARLRITARLVDATTGFELWSQSYDRDQNDILKVQADIAAAVTASLRVTLLGEDAARMALGGTTNPAAFDAYLRGMKFLYLGKDSAYALAVAAFDEAIALDPNYALAHVRRAHAVRDTAAAEDSGPPGWAQKMEDSAIASAARAVMLAPDLGAAHAEYGATLEESRFDFAGALAELTRARTLSPGDAQTNMAYAELQVHLRHFDKAIEAAQLAASLDPLTPRTYRHLAGVLTLARRQPEAMQAVRRAEQLDGVATDEDIELEGEVLLYLGRPDDARRVCLPARSWSQNLCLAIAFHALGDQPAAEAALARLRSQLADNGAVQYVEIYSQWNQPGTALDWLETAYRLHDPGLIELKVVPNLDPIRATARYRDIERRLEFPR